MFYHAFPVRPHSTQLTITHWWAFHAETFAAVRIHLRYPAPGATTTMADLVIVWPPPEFVGDCASHLAVTDHQTIRQEILAELSTLIPDVIIRRCKLASWEPANQPDYRAVFSLDGTRTAILRYADPFLVIPTEPKNDRRLAAAIPYFRSATDLPAEGFAYWWEDAAQAWDEIIAPFYAAPADAGK